MFGVGYVGGLMAFGKQVYELLYKQIDKEVRLCIYFLVSMWISKNSVHIVIFHSFLLHH